VIDVIYVGIVALECIIQLWEWKFVCNCMELLTGVSRWMCGLCWECFLNWDRDVAHWWSGAYCHGVFSAVANAWFILLLDPRPLDQMMGLWLFIYGDFELDFFHNVHPELLYINPLGDLTFLIWSMEVLACLSSIRMSCTVLLRMSSARSVNSLSSCKLRFNISKGLLSRLHNF